MKKILFLCLIIFGMIIAASCARDIRLEAVETVNYQNTYAGYSITLPESWHKTFEDDISTGFSSEEPDIFLDIVFEIGGYDYFSYQGLSEVVAEALGEKIPGLTMLDSGPYQGPEAYQFTAAGSINSNDDIIVKGFIWEPEMGIRYYLIFTADEQDYPQLDRLFLEIADTFTVEKTGMDLYPLIDSRTEEVEKD